MHPLTSDLAVELKWVALLSRPKLTEQQISECRALSNKVNFNTAKLYLAKSRTWPCVHLNVKQYCSDQVPKDLQKLLEEKYQKNSCRSRLQFIELHKIQTAFKAADINVGCFKGCFLAQKLYGDLAKRHSKDIDLIIEQDNITKAHPILVSLGYRCKLFEALSDTHLSLYFNTHKDLTYINNDGIELELHVRINKRPTTLSTMFVHSLLHPKEKKQATLYEFIYLCWHGAYSHNFRLKWLLDIALYIENQPQSHLFCHQVLKTATSLEVKRYVVVVWTLANLIFHCPLPDEINTSLKKDWISQTIIKMLIKIAFKKRTEILYLQVFNDRLLELMFTNKWSERFSIIRYTIFEPNIADITRLPKISIKYKFIHYLTRPFFLIYRIINKSLRQTFYSIDDKH